MAPKLLLADDSVTIQRVIELTFADEDVEVTTVGDGQSAIDRLETDPPDIVLADIDMPKRDGYEVAAYIRSRPKLAHIPVVLLTGAFEPIDQVRAAAAGSTDVLTKPFEPQMVINRVKELLGRRRQDEVEQYDMPPQRSLAPPPTPQVPQLQMEEPTPASRQTPGGGEQPISLDDYFDQLDAAFSNLQPSTQLTDDTSDDMDWMASAPGVPAAAVAAPPPPAAPKVEPLPAPPIALAAPVADAVQQATSDAWAPEPVAPIAPIAPIPPIAPVAPVAPVASVAPSAARVTANPFASLSAAKAEAAARPAAPVITDEVIEEVVARVLQRLSDKVVRETVAEIVSQIAERLVQEEIDRIKSQGQ